MSADGKSQHLMQYVDLDRPDLAEVRVAADPARAFVEYVARPPRARFRFEWECKAEMLSFLAATYRSWREFNAAEADRVAGLTIEQAQGSRALAAVAELGKAWWATGDPAYGAAFERFYLAVPTGEMFSWDSFNGSQGAIELSAYFLLLDCPSFTAEGRIAYLDHLCAIADQAWDTHTSTWQQIMLGPEGHNWYLHGAQVLPFIGLLFPEFKRSDLLLRSGASIFEEHVRGHYKDDGGARETTLGYQAGSMRSLWDYYAIAHRNGYPLPTDFAARLLNATRFLLGLMSPVGGLPSFGDGGHSPGALTGVAAVAAALTGDPACKWYAERCRAHVPEDAGCAPGQIPLSAFWSVGLAGAETYARARERDPGLASVLFGPTGYAALRSSDAPDAGYMAIAAANRGPIVTSHGHNDVFSMDIHAGGTRFLGEMGCAPYGVSPGREYDQKTEAHSCLAIDGMEQAPLRGEWRWNGRVIPAVRRWITAPTHDFFHGVHEGFYVYPDHKTLHARKVFFVKSEPQYWVVFDWLDSDVESDVSVYFHGCVAGRLDGRAIMLGGDDGQRLVVSPPDGDELAVEAVTNDGLSAYIEERKLDAAAYPCFAYRKRTASDCFVWAIVPQAAGDTSPVIERLPVQMNGSAVDPHRAAAVRLSFAGCTDTICVSHTEFDSELQVGPSSTWGIIAYERATPAGETVLAINHTVVDGVCGR